MIFGAPSKFAALNQFVSAEYHLLLMIFSSECFLQSNYFNKIHWFLPPGTALVSPRADHGQANGSVPGTLWECQCQPSSGVASDKKGLGGAGRSSAGLGCLEAHGIPSLLSLFWTEHFPLPTPPGLSLGHG